MKKNCLAAAMILLISACNSTHEVNLFMGTSGDHGQVSPGAQVPFGMISVCPDSDPPQHCGYDWAVPEISGVSITRVSGVGCSGGGGDVRIRPCPESEPVSIVKGTEKAVPGYYETLFSNGTRGSFTATVNTALERYDFRPTSSKVFHIDFSSSVIKRLSGIKPSGYTIKDDRTIEGWTVSPTVCARGSYKLYFTLVSDTPFKVVGTEEKAVDVEFPEKTRSVEIRIGTSTVDEKSARDAYGQWKNLSFNKIRRMAAKDWEEKLSKIEVEGGTEEDRIIFYTSLYRLYLSPMVAQSPDGRHIGTDGNIYDNEGYTFYGSWSMWDTFRTKFPLLVLLEGEASSDICNSLIDLFKTGKNQWTTPYEAAPSVRTEHSVITILDAVAKGVQGINLEKGYEGMVKEAENDLPMTKPDQRLESSYDLWALGKIAEILGRTEDAKKYSERADSLFIATWVPIFMEITPEFTLMKDNGLYQGSKWQHRWNAPHFIDKMIDLVGRDSLESQLEEFFEKRLYNQGNEPDIHTPFIFNRFGRPDKTAAVVNSYLTDDEMVHIYGGNAEYPEPFVGRAFRNAPDGYAPEMDEDDGAMSSWYIFASSGLYPLLVGSDEYEVFSPHFDKIVIRSGEAPFTILTRNRKHLTDKAKAVTLNGKPLERTAIKHSDITSGGELLFSF